MKKNKVQFQKGYSLTQLHNDYGTEEQCHEALYKWRWPDGFICPKCGSTSYCILKTHTLYQCNDCRRQTSITSGTIFADTKLPLTTWFLAIYLITQDKTGLSALSLKRLLGVSYNTALTIKHKVQQVMMERENARPLSGVIQLDDVYYGGQRQGGKRGRGSPDKIPFVAAVSTNEEGHPMAMTMNVVSGFSLDGIKRWAKQHLTEGSYVVSDGLPCFSAVTEAGCIHQAIITGGGIESVKEEAFLWVNTMIGNVKNAITGTYHSVSLTHLPRYLAEFCYRFNRRFELDKLLPRFMYIALRTKPKTRKDFILA